MKVELLDYMGSDLSVCKAARVSFNKEPENYTEEQNVKLIKYLAKHNHWTPFSHTCLTFRVTAPLPIRTQCFKHKVGLVENECYTDEIEVLTSQGFLKWRDTKEHTIFASPDINTGQIHFEKALSHIERDYEGPVISFFGSEEFIEVTPQHEVFVFDKDKKENIKYSAEYIYDNYLEKDLYLYKVTPFNKEMKTLISRIDKEKIIEANIRNYKGKVYCAETVTGLLIVKKGNVISINGNCSRRYITEEPTCFIPEFRLKAEFVKQGSSDEIHPMNQQMQSLYKKITDKAIQSYLVMIDQGVAPEQARFILPQGMETTWIWTGNLYSFFNFYKKRTDVHAQKEVRDLAEMIGEHCKQLFPVSWEALNDN